MISPIEEIIEDAREGRIFILVDAEDRENEGDLVIPAQFATPAQVNFMARFGRGLICLTLSEERIHQLGLEPMTRRNQTRMQTAFTVSIEAKTGVTTGISAADRARTIAVAIDSSKGAEDIVSPGHVFPLGARNGGVLVRAGHTEASVDISRQAGLNPSAVICEIMNDDGSMARLPELAAFAQSHGLKIGTIADLIAYRRAHDRYVERIHEAPFAAHEGFRLLVFRNRLDGIEHVALVMGDIRPDHPTLVRVHRIDFAADLLAGWGERASFITATMKAVEAEGAGVLLMLRDLVPDPVSRLLKGQEDESADEQSRLVGLGSQILHDLGVGQMIVLSNSQQRLIGLEGYGLKICGWRTFPA
ncbi:3,4-dihydroxy-2-butanone-4-phosphate synthase [Novosphingobium album (ex Liu et al. 2023)]|uniref:3,4-dihydroxy-2-butanone 4-phosphate synthase n=1 Tax=Novosphingobium album (ex Liu et al. 2023) TaxID=3031130 RepID=A0ABT5WTI9_9SPHN|nr:3,4-dihydroxy-2-butanone-4-phosphate synthase [Novosphingobium album (ex Liu et al. 2023)]MDE8653203.1 3,4-dihydroxy-2-butanone-4-phosphate synthase [Novosphingobium album (ex Liu et al. 2023)]